MAKTVTRKAETVVHTCPGDMVVRMRTVMTVPRTGVICVHLALSLFSYIIVDFEISTPIFYPVSNRSDHKSLCVGVGYMAFFNSKYTDGSSDGS